MHYDRDYSQYPDLRSKDAAALLDLLKYLGYKRYSSIFNEFKKVPIAKMTFKRFELYMSIAGIHGYPVITFYKSIYNLSTTEDKLHHED